MKLIKPAEISAKIMTLIDEAEKELIIISPYNNISGWNKLVNRIKKAQTRGVSINWYSRKNNVDSNNSEEVSRNVGIHPILIDDLHAKIYMNEESAIFTSMNMSRVSDEKSLDLGYITERKEEFDEIQNFYRKHIQNLGNMNEAGQKTNEASSANYNSKEIFSTISSYENYVKAIYEHIHCNYGSFSYENNRGDVIEYFDFPKAGYKVQFIPYSKAIKIQICLPQSENPTKVHKRITTNYEFKKLYNKSEFLYFKEDNKSYVKYYFDMYDKKLESWVLDNFKQFFNNLDIIICAIKNTKC